MSHCDHNRDWEAGTDDSWWEYDARGIPLAKVCDKCRKEKLRGFRPEVLTDSSYEADEDIDGDYGWDDLAYHYGPAMRAGAED
jgi:hypothetical protein